MGDKKSGQANGQNNDWFTRKVLPHGGPLRSYLLGLLKSEDAAEDAVQETYLKLLKVKDPQSIDRPKAFIFRVAHNLVIQNFRKKQVAATDTVADMDDLSVIDETPLVEEQLIARQRLEALNAAIEALPPVCQRVFIMRKVHKLTHQEIAGTLKISRSSVEKHIAKGVKRCRAELQQYDQLLDEDVPTVEAERARQGKEP